MTQPTPRLSRIITIFNQWHYLDWLDDEALYTAETEYIVVDDCSDQALPNELAARFQSRHITFHRLPRNSGRCAARNTGAQLARGEFLDFIDGDDRPLPMAYDPAWADAEVVFFSVTARGAEADIRRSLAVHPLLPAPDGPDGHLDPRPAAVLWRRTTFARLGGFDPRYETAEDMELVFRACNLARAFCSTPKQSYTEQPHADYTQMTYSAARMNFFRRLPLGHPLRQRLLDDEVQRISLYSTWILLGRRHYRFLFRHWVALLWNLLKARFGRLNSAE